MKKILLGVLAVAGLVSCSNDEVLEQNRFNDEIKFNAVVNNASRAQNVFCNNNMPGKFVVTAKYDSKIYFNAQEYGKIDGIWKNLEAVNYWPNEGAVSFYAHVNATGVFDWENNQLKDFVVVDNVANQQDFLYAVKTSSKNDAPVGLNFRHALSQVVFSAKNTNPNLYVEIEGVKLCNLGNKNTFTFPTADTDNNIVDHTGSTHVITYNESWGTWNTLNGGSNNFGVTFTAVPVNGNNTVVSLTSASDAGKEFSSNAMLLLPQTTTAWDITTVGDPDNGQTGSYFLLNCKIYNVAGKDFNSATDVCLWGTDAGDYKELAIPVSFKFEQGKKYIYTFVFGTGNGGYDPEPTDPTKPSPVLVPITFNVTVDDFIEVLDQDVETGLPSIKN